MTTPSDNPGALPPTRSWTSVAGAWLGIGTAPGALLLGAGIATRHQGTVPLVSLVLGFGLMYTLIWFQGRLGLVPPLGDGGGLTEIASRYFDARTQKLIGALIAVGMIGWQGFSVGLGAAAFGSLIQIPQWVAVLILGLPILFLSLRGIKGWNGFAAVTTISVLILVVLVATQLGAHAMPVSWGVDDPSYVLADMAVLVGYVSVFVVRAPDFTAGLTTRRDLHIVGLMLCVPLLLVVLVGVDLRQGTGTDDLVGILARPGGLAIGNLLIALAVLAPTFTTYYSGVPALRAATGIDERTAMLIFGLAGTALAIARFDLWLLTWLGLLAAVMPPLIVPLAFESTARRRGVPARSIPPWVWLAGAVVSLALTLAQQPLALLAGMLTAALAAGLWYRSSLNLAEV